MNSNSGEYSPFEGNLRAKGQSKIEKTLQVPEVQELVACPSDITERTRLDRTDAISVLEREAYEKAEKNGEGGIRTRGTPKSTPVFETGSLSHSDTSPQPLLG